MDCLFLLSNPEKITMKFKIAFLRVTIITLFFLTDLAFAQSTSVFDANYFSKGSEEPPIEVGKGFNITDVFKQTKHCFTPESSTRNKLKPKSTGVKTNISLHYTQDEKTYNYFKSNGVSGKVSYLNLFSLGGDKLQELTTNNNETTERLIFLAKVDFGVYSYDTDPILSAEAKSLITGNKFDEFVQLYGSHYISGVRKGNTITVVMTKKTSTTTDSETDNNSIAGGATFPIKVGVNYEVTESEVTENILKSGSYDISVEITGPSLDKTQIVNGINDILSDNNESNKINSIKALITSSMEKISNPEQSMISQYYYAPFTLYGLNTINWDERKQNNLIKINEHVIKVYSTKSGLEDYIAPNSLTEALTEFNNVSTGFSKKTYYSNEIKTSYNKLLPKAKQYKSQLDSCAVVLENLYKNCSDLHCASTDNCCNVSTTTEFINGLVSKSNSETDNFMTVYSDALDAAIEDASTPECEKNKKGYILIINKSTNPYDIYQGSTYLETLQGGYQKKFSVGIGTYSFRATQKSGFLVYPTVNDRTANVTSYCQEVILKVGFED